MLDILQAISDGVLFGATYALIGIGFTLVFGVMHKLNLSYAAASVGGAYAGLLILKVLVGAAPWQVFLCAFAAGGVIGYLVYLLCFHFIPLANPLATLMSTVGMLLLMENADPISKPTELYEWVNGGLRIVGPAWRGSRYAGGTGEPGPLTALGRGLLGEMQRLGVILDISHLAEESFWQALDLFTGPVIASHANCRVFTPTDRHLSDEMIRALIARDAVIGTVLANKFLDPAWAPGAPLPLNVVIRHIDHICELAGDATHCALGSDFDGGFGAESTPDGFDSVADLSKIADTLSAHGYTSADIESIMGGAWLRLLRRSLPAEFEPVSR